MIRKHLQRLVWRFTDAGKKPSKSFTVNQNDIEALKGIDEYVERMEKNLFHSNELFAKLYIFMFMRVLENEKSTVYDNSARRRIGNLLSKPLEQVISDLVDSLNDSELYNWLENLGIEIKHPALRTEAETIDISNKLNNALKTPLKSVLEPVWEYETVYPAVIAEVNSMIQIHQKK